MTDALTHTQLWRWRLAIFAIFTSSGLSIATWASRVPAIKVTLGVDNVQVGLMLLGAGIASVIGLSSGQLVLARFGARRGMLVAIFVFAIGVFVVGVGTDAVQSFPLVALGLVLFGLGNGSVDIMMNVEGAALEKESGRTLLPLFHGFFSLGTVLGAGTGFFMSLWGVNVLVHTSIILVLLVSTGLVAIANVPARAIALDTPPHESKPHWRERLHLAMAAWREPRTYVIGVVMLGMSFAEGGANDWLTLAVVDGHDGTPAMGAAALAVLSSAMTAVRMFGGPLVDRFGRVATLRVFAATGATGMLLFILAPSIPLMFVGAALWGAGVALAFPIGMSAAADDPAKAAARVSAVATIGYVAFLGGPPLLGLISEGIGILNTLYILVALVVISGFASGGVKPLAGTSVGRGRA